MYSESLKRFEYDWKKAIMKEKTWNIELKREEGWLFRLDNWKLCNEEGLIVSEAMKKAINLTYYRRWLQDKYNKDNNITPKTVFSEIKDMWLKTKNKEFETSISKLL